MSNFKNNGFVEPYCPNFLVTFFKKNLPPTPLKTLDYGCGYGGWTKKIREIIPAGEVCVFDIDAEAEQFTRKLVDSKLQFSEADQYDLIVSIGVIDILASEELIADVLQRMNRALSPNGIVLLETCAYEPLSMRWIFYAFRSIFNARAWHNTFRFRRVYFNHKMLGSMLDTANFKIRTSIHPRFLFGVGNSINEIGSKFPSYLHDLSFYILEKK